MAAIAMAESGGCPSAYNGGGLARTESSYGLWQINVQGNPTLLNALGLTSASQLNDPSTNAAAAYYLYSTSGFAPWSTYNNGAYQVYLPSTANSDGSTLAATIDPSTDLPTATSGIDLTDPTTLALVGVTALVAWLAFR